MRNTISDSALCISRSLSIDILSFLVYLDQISFFPNILHNSDSIDQFMILIVFLNYKYSSICAVDIYH